MDTCPTTDYYTFGTTCVACSLGCKNCVGPNSNQCSVCYAGYFFQSNNSCVVTCSSPSNFGNPLTLTCVTSCPTGYFKNSTNRMCTLCDPNCLTCDTTSTKCLTCATGTFLINNFCDVNCPSTHYKNTPTNQCLPCNSACLTCSGGTSSNCLSCSAPLFFDSS